MALVYHYCLHKLHKLPHEIFDLPPWEQAIVLGSIGAKIEEDKERDRKIRQETQKRRR